VIDWTQADPTWYLFSSLKGWAAFLTVVLHSSIHSTLVYIYTRSQPDQHSLLSPSSVTRPSVSSTPGGCDGKSFGLGFCSRVIRGEVGRSNSSGVAC